jgi:FMN phosphatase YigB (HAD superfamily)
VITTLLLDLDDTLLENSDEIFIPAYFELLSEHLGEIIPKERMLSYLFAGTKAMLDNKDPSLHLKDVFDQVFYPGVQFPYEELQAYTDQFYATEFPKLKSLTNQISETSQIYEFALSKGMEVVIATNPLYPKSAVEQRLAWAELSVDEFDYALVTSYENSHFAKPNLEYYAEILGKLGRNPHDALMIGNDKNDDIDPARALGIATFHISDDTTDTLPSGSHSQALDWLKASPVIIDPRIAATPESLSARLMGNLMAFGALSSNEVEDSWRRKPNPDTWAAVEVIAHLRDVELEINYPRIQSILLSEEPFLSAVDSDSWAEERGYIDSSPIEVLDSLWQARMKTITLLKNQGSNVWKRNARHAIFGPTNLAELVLIFIEHDLLHLRQLRTTLNLKL